MNRQALTEQVKNTGSRSLSQVLREWISESMDEVQYALDTAQEGSIHQTGFWIFETSAQRTKIDSSMDFVTKQLVHGLPWTCQAVLSQWLPEKLHKMDFEDPASRSTSSSSSNSVFFSFLILHPLLTYLFFHELFWSMVHGPITENPWNPWTSWNPSVHFAPIMKCTWTTCTQKNRNRQ